MSFNTFGIDELKIQLRRLENVPLIASETMKASAEELRQKARDMAPEDFGDLKRAIQTRATAAQGAGGRLVGLRNYEVFVNNNTSVRDPKKIRGAGKGAVKVGDYAWLVHEYMGYGSVPGYLPNGRSFNPSAESIAAGEKAGVEAGGKFLERATISLEGKIQADMMRAIRKYVEALDFG